MPRNGFGRLALMKLRSYVKEALDLNAVPCSAAVESNIMRTASALLSRCTEDEKVALAEGGEIPEWLGFEEVAAQFSGQVLAARRLAAGRASSKAADVWIKAKRPELMARLKASLPHLGLQANGRNIRAMFQKFAWAAWLQAPAEEKQNAFETMRILQMRKEEDAVAGELLDALPLEALLPEQAVANPSTPQTPWRGRRMRSRENLTGVVEALS